jgi:hypothetical protein
MCLQVNQWLRLSDWIESFAKIQSSFQASFNFSQPDPRFTSSVHYQLFIHTYVCKHTVPSDRAVSYEYLVRFTLQYVYVLVVKSREWIRPTPHTFSPSERTVWMNQSIYHVRYYLSSLSGIRLNWGAARKPDYLRKCEFNTVTSWWKTRQWRLIKVEYLNCII